MQKIRIKKHKDIVITISRTALNHSKIVYIAVSDRVYRHPNSKSRIVYIGQTEAGAERVAESAAYRAGKLLDIGIKFNSLEFFVISIKGKQGLMSPQKHLEKDLLKLFKQLYGAIPKGNTQGKNFDHNDLSGKFTESRLRGIIRSFE